MITTANISTCGKYRYRLARIWDEKKARRAVFVMLNPSTADALIDDPTIRKCIGFAGQWGQQKWLHQIGGLGGIVVVNLFALRATDPTELSKSEDPIGPENDDYIRRELWAARAAGSIVVCAWGANKEATSRQSTLIALLNRYGDRHNTFRIGPLTKDGHPRHPLYLPYHSGLEVF